MKTKLLSAFFPLIILFAADGFAQIREIKGAKFTKRTEIHKFDFYNSTYEAGCSGEIVRVKNGFYKPKGEDGAYFQFAVTVSYGDLNGDGVQEVLVVTRCDGAVQNYDEGKIYTVVNHRLVKIAELKVGTKNGGDILDGTVIKNGRIIVKRGPGPNLCTNIEGAAEETADFRLRGGKLRQIGKSICRSI